jgi:Flp pilus assembly protein CpaB
MPEPRLILRPWRKALLRHRRLLLALLTAATVMAFAEHIRPAPPPETLVVVASRDLAAGTVIEPDHVRSVGMPTAIVPAGTASDARQLVGETVAGPVRAGEPLTDRRVVADSLLAGYPAGSVAAPVRVTDADVVALIQVGDRVDVYAADPRTEQAARLIVVDAPVVSVPATGDSSSQGGLVVLAVDASDAALLAASADGEVVSLVLRP